MTIIPQSLCEARHRTYIMGSSGAMFDLWFAEGDREVFPDPGDDEYVENGWIWDEIPTDVLPEGGSYE